MKHFYGFMLFFLLSVFSYAQEDGLIKFSTTHALGEEISFFPTPVINGEKIKVDWGDGEIKEYAVSMFFKKVSANKVGDTIKIYTQLQSFDCSDGKVTSLSIFDQPGLEVLQCYNNKLTRDSLDISGALNLKTLDCHTNKLLFLDLRNHTKLTTLDCFDYEEGTITTILLPESGAALESLTAYGNDISSLDVSGCPLLTVLNVENNALMDIDVSMLPDLQTLNVAGNIISSLNLSKNPKLEKIFCGGNQLEKLDLYANPELIEVSCSENKLTELDLSKNTSLTKLYCSNNQLTALDVRGIPKLLQLQCGYNRLNELDLSGNFYLKKLWCQANQLTFLDLYYNQNIDYIDCRDNAGMTPCALNYMYGTLSGLDSPSANDNLLVTGCNAETSDTDIAKEARWQTDVNGDGTAVCEKVEITVAEPENGTFTLSQPNVTSHDSIPVENNKVKAGVPVYVKAVPAEGYKVKNILVNESPVYGSVFVTSEPVSLAVQFVPLTSRNYLLMEVEEGTSLSFGIGGTEQETEVEIDWGNGKLDVYALDNTNIFRIEGVSKGTTIRINGLIDYFDCSENDLLALDVSHNNELKTLDCYWTGITALDLSKNTELAKLNCSYNELETLDVTANTKLFSLTCYNCELKALDISRNILLEELTAKNNNLFAIDLSANTKLLSLDLQNNKLANVDFSALTELEALLCSGNGMATLDVTHNVKLTNLVCSNNELTTIDLSKNVSLERLFCDANKLESLDLNNNEALNYIECSGNGMSACALNDFYYRLPVCPIEPEKINLYNVGISNPNNAEHSETSLAVQKGWKVSAEGDGTGCEEAYITVIQPENGMIELYDDREQKFESGSKVTKNSTVEVKAVPEEGYELEYVKANGVTAADNKFVVNRATEVTAKFSILDRVENKSEIVNAWGGKNVVHLTGENTSVQIYTAEGIRVYENEIQGSVSVSLSSGMYIVKLVTTGNTLSRLVTVR